MKKYGIIGKNIGYTLSPKIYNWFFKKYKINAVYNVIDIDDSNSLKSFLKVSTEEYSGYNVTIPYKMDVLSYLDNISREARVIGSVNIITSKEGKLNGDNTDWIGFIKSLKMFVPNPSFSKAIVIGAGGAGRAIVYALTRYVDEIIIFSKSGTTAEKLSQDSEKWGCLKCRGLKYSISEVTSSCRDAELIVNASPLGGPHAPSITPVPLTAINSGQVIYETNYKPKETLLLSFAKKAGATAINGIWMLLHQAVENLKIWFNTNIDVMVLKKSLSEEL